MHSQARINKHLSSVSTPQISVDLLHSTEVKLHLGDAVHRSNTKISLDQHPLDSMHLEEPYDTILALDCAYHFRSRELFLRQAFETLKPGGRVGLADICFDHLPAHGAFTKWLITLLFVPSENVEGWHEYRERMTQIGFTDIELEDITGQVFPGFVSFLETRSLGWRMFARVFATFITPSSRFVLISAMRP